MWRKLCPRFRNWRNISRIDMRSASVAPKLATSQIATQTREKASPDLVAKIVPPTNAASNPHASSSWRDSSAKLAPRWGSYNRKAGNRATIEMAAATSSSR
jgi:hypothetical protein